MQKRTNVATLSDLGKQKVAGRMTIGIDLGDRRSHFCALNDQAQVIAPGLCPRLLRLSVANLRLCRQVSLRSKPVPILYGSTKC